MQEWRNLSNETLAGSIVENYSPQNVKPLIWSPF